MHKRVVTILALIVTSTAAQAEYVKAKPGNDAARAEAYCNMVARGQQRGFMAFGNQDFVAGAAIGNGIGNLIRASLAKKDCMVMQGYEWVKPKGARKQPVGTNAETN